MRALSKVKIDWNPNFAYAIGLIATDGNLSPDGRHINFTTKDLDLAEKFREALNLTNKIGRKARGYSTEKKYFVVQFSDVSFYDFLIAIGLTPNKSKTLGPIDVPPEFFYDFLRGCLDGDGNINEYKHIESQYLQLKVRFYSASKIFVEWIQDVTKLANLKGYITKNGNMFSIAYGKVESKKLLKAIYNSGTMKLERKFLVAQKYII